jgi:hypothetical protein
MMDGDLHRADELSQIRSEFGGDDALELSFNFPEIAYATVELGYSAATQRRLGSVGMILDSDYVLTLIGSLLRRQGFPQGGALIELAQTTFVGAVDYIEEEDGRLALEIRDLNYIDPADRLEYLGAIGDPLPGSFAIDFGAYDMSHSDDRFANPYLGYLFDLPTTCENEEPIEMECVLVGEGRMYSATIVLYDPPVEFSSLR